jgi:hypothetical protein
MIMTQLNPFRWRIARPRCASVRRPKSVAKTTAATKEGSYDHWALQASGGTYPFLPGTAVVQDAVGEEDVVEAKEVEVGVAI